MLSSKKTILKDSFEPRLEKLDQWTEQTVVSIYGAQAMAVKESNGLVMIADGSGTFDDESGVRSILSIDGTGWTTTDLGLPSPETVEDMVYSPDDDLWVICGGRFDTSCFIITSDDDGATWVDRTVPSQDSTLNSIAYGNGNYVAVGDRVLNDKGRLYTSPDGITWTKRTIPVTNIGLNSVIYFNNLWIAIGGSQGAGEYYYLTATDPTGTWTESNMTLVLSGYNTVIRDTLIANPTINSNGLSWAETKDGLNWTSKQNTNITAKQTASLVLTEHRGKVLFSGGYPNPPYEGSPTGTLNSLNEDEIPNYSLGYRSLGPAHILSVINDTSLFGQRISQSGLQIYTHSPKGPTGPPAVWKDGGPFAVSPIKANLLDSNIIVDMVWAEELGLFIAVGEFWPDAASLSRNWIMISSDGVTFDEAPSYYKTSRFTLTGVAWDGTTAVAVGYRYDTGFGFPDYGTIFTSTDGHTWTAFSEIPTTAEPIYGISYDGTTFVTVGENGEYGYATDPTGTWTFGYVSGSAGDDLYSITHDGTNFIACGQFDSINSEMNVWYSSTGTGSWTERTGIYPSYWVTTNSCFTVAAGPNGNGQDIVMFAGAGGRGATTRSITDQTQYTERDIDTSSTQTIDEVNYGAHHWVAFSGGAKKIYYEQDPEQDSWQEADITDCPVAECYFNAGAYSPSLGRWTGFYRDGSNSTFGYGIMYADSY